MEHARFTELFENFVEEALQETDFNKRKEKFSVVQDQWYFYFGSQSEKQEVIRRGLETLISVKKVYKDVLGKEIDEKIKFLISKIDIIK